MTVQDQTSATHGVLLTDVAATKVKSLLEQEGRDDLRLRVGVQPGGCSGLIYQLYFDERVLDGDATKDFDGVEVIVDVLGEAGVPRLQVGDDELLLGAEPVVEGLLRRAGLERDAVDTDRPDAVVVEEVGRRAQDARGGGRGRGRRGESHDVSDEVSSVRSAVASHAMDRRP